MTEVLIITLALWTYPLLALLLVWLTRNKPTARKKLIRFSILLSLLAVFGILTNVSTTLSAIDWILISSIYFSVSLLLWILYFKQQIIYSVIAGLGMVAVFGILTNVSTTLSAIDWILISSIYFSVSLLLWILYFKQQIIYSVIAGLGMVAVFGIGYLSSTIGWLGLGFVVGEFTTENEQWLGDGLIYKEITLGNAIADYRGKRVEIDKTISWLPILEWRVKTKEYYNVITYMIKPLTVEYKPSEEKIYLSASM